MAYLSIEEIKTHLYTEQVEVITGGDNTLLQASIDGAVSEAKGYLAAFDIKNEFEKIGDERNALLVIFLKDIAVWHFVNICNVNTDLGLRMERYKRAVDWLKAVQRGEVAPDLEKMEPEKQTGVVLFSSNPKRNNHF